jgi:predicted alpha/beta-fold hydrolase
MMIKSAFKPAWWLSNPHAQTMYPTLMRRRSIRAEREERVELPDGDFIDLVWAEHGLSAQTPLVIFLHGLGGSMESSYVAGQMRAFNQCGWRAVLMHFRGASREPNRLARAYHSGDTGDLDYIVRVLHQREPQTLKAMVGISLGGNVLLKWLGEQGAQSLVQAAVAVSVPFQLRLVADRINQGFSQFYQMYLLKRLKQMFIRKCEKYKETMPFSTQELNALRCFWTFDDVITAPLHGFPHVHAYYAQSSSRQYLKHIKTPTLIIHAQDDPFMTPLAIPEAEELSEAITFELSLKGGHVGFITGDIPGKPIYWLDQRVPEFLQTYLMASRD